MSMYLIIKIKTLWFSPLQYLMYVYTRDACQISLLRDES